jgi:hypothetical protein
MNRDLDHEVKAAQAKVAYWTGKARLYGGEIHMETLARMEANLSRLLRLAKTPARSWKQRLAYHANIAPVRVLFNCPDIERRALLAQRRIRAEVYADNHPRLQGRAYFTHTPVIIPSHQPATLAGLL